MGKSWKLINVVTGDSKMRRGQMDVEFVDGSVVELTEPEAIVAQRIEKASVEPQGSNRFAPGWGSIFRALLAAKMVAGEIVREIGTGLRLLVDALIVEQSRVARRMPLQPAETVVGLNSATVGIGTDTIEVEARIAIGDGTTAAARLDIEQD